MNNTQILITVAAVVLGTVITRFLPFIVFREGKETPKFVQYMGKALPSAVFAMIVVYCLKGMNFTVYPYGAAEIIAVLAVILIHLKWKQILISVAGGTAIYMILVQMVFV